MRMQKTEASNQNVSILPAVVGIYERGNNRRSRGEPDPGADPMGDSEAKDDTESGASTTIAMMKDNHIKFDLYDVFTVIIVDSKDPHVITKTVDLYKDYGSLEVKEVAKSNRFYSTMVRDPSRAIFENLQLTYDYLVNNTEYSFVQKLNEHYQTYPFEERGGPLFFKLLVDFLQPFLAIHSQKRQMFSKHPPG